MHLLISVLTALVLLASTPTYADKPEWAGEKSKPSAEQKAAHKAAMTSKRGEQVHDSEMQGKMHQEMEQHRNDQETHAEDADNQHDKMMKKADKKKASAEQSALGKPQEMNSGDVQQASGKGSDKGQKTRETGKKWWRFWEEE